MAVATSVRERLHQLFEQRIVILDGSIGVLLQRKGLDESGYRGERFRDHPKLLRNDAVSTIESAPPVCRASS